MTGKIITVTAVLAAGMLLLGGCEMMNQEKWEPQESDAISLAEDGSITEYIHEELDQAYYSADELQSQVNSEVSDYNSRYGEDSVTVGEYAAEGSSVSLQLKYATAEDYARFNNVEFYYGSMINAQLEGYLFDVSYKRVQDGVVSASSVSGSDVIREMDKQVMVVQAPLEVHVPGNVLYTSSNAEVLAADVVNATGETREEEAQTLELPSSTVYYYDEAGGEQSHDAAAAASRVYIVFEME